MPVMPVITAPRVPRRGESVHVDGHEGRFIVVRVDKVQEMAAVELWSNPGQGFSAPFAGIHLIRHYADEAA